MATELLTIDGATTVGYVMGADTITGSDAILLELLSIMENSINWIIALIEAGVAITSIRTKQDLSSSKVIDEKLVFSPIAGEEHLIVVTDINNLEHKATITE